ncbi:MAG: hypothetical protein AAF581_18105 [Planctomycetota bacterium]
MADKIVLSVGTKRGLFLLESNKRRQRWEIKGPFLKGWSINHAMIDTRGKPRLHVAGWNFTYANATFTADVNGKKFTGCENPPVPPKLTEKQAAQAKEWGISTAERTWLIHPGPAKEKKVLYAGTAPAGLFRSEDRGKSWQPVSGLNEHPSREDWGPGAGGMCLHSFQIDPHDSQKMYAAISAAGAFRTDDGGDSWKPINDMVEGYVGAPEESGVGT